MRIENNFPANMAEVHKALYLKNCEEILKQGTGNKEFVESLKLSNFILINFYLNANN